MLCLAAGLLSSTDGWFPTYAGALTLSLSVLLGAGALAGWNRRHQRVRWADARRRESLANHVELQAAVAQVAALEVAVDSERARAEAAERQLAEVSAQAATLESELNDARATRASFLATVSHELRTPLHAVIGFTELVRDGSCGPVNNKQREYLDDARAAAQHLMRLISDVLDFAKSDAGRLRFASETVTVSDLLAQVKSLVEPQAAKKMLALESTCDENLTLLGDALRVKQVLLNLVGNAVKFTPRRGRVTIEARSTESICELTVRDTGPGIPFEEHQRVFEPFHQADDSTARQHSGTGLGLALVKRWTEAMGGTVQLDSELGRGSSFTLRFPRPANVAPLRRMELVRPRLNVLIAEDDEATRVMLARVLESRGCEVRQAGNGQRALEAVMEELPAVLILDLMMPELDGHDMLRKLRRLPNGSDVKVLVFSASRPEGEQRAQLEELGAEVLMKGAVTPSEVAARVIEGPRTRTAA